MYRHRRLTSVCAALAIACVLSPSVRAGQDDAAAIVREQCASCHALTDEARNGADFSERLKRLGPPLDYAGNKYRAEWLVKWLQEPLPIRPAGYYPPKAVVATAENKDEIDESALKDHPSLPEEQAEVVAEYLMTLTSREDLVSSLNVQPKNQPAKIAELNFGKFKGCIACHRDQPDRGGVSGPELYTAWQRATPEFLFSYIEDPTAWDRHTTMPVAGLNDTEIEKLVGYLKLIGEDAE